MGKDGTWVEPKGHLRSMVLGCSTTEVWCLVGVAPVMYGALVQH
jgi:hypothetical protein